MICLRGTDGESMAKTDITKRALAESFKALMRKKPFNKISVESICEGAGTSRRNFYRHFLDKYELLTWVYYEDFVKEMEATPYSRALDLFPGSLTVEERRNLPLALVGLIFLHFYPCYCVDTICPNIV